MKEPKRRAGACAALSTSSALKCLKLLCGILNFIENKKQRYECHIILIFLNRYGEAIPQLQEF